MVRDWRSGPGDAGARAQKTAREFAIHNVHDGDHTCKTCRRKDCHSDHGHPGKGGRAHPGVKGGIFPRQIGPESPHGNSHSHHPMSAAALHHAATAARPAVGHVNSNVTRTVYRHQLADEITAAATAWDGFGAQEQEAQ